MSDDARLYFDEHAWSTIAAAMDRVIPADDTPGASEAGTIRWLDRYLSGTSCVRAKPDGSGFEVLAGREKAVWEARIERLRRIYAAGVNTLDETAQSAFGADFAVMTTGQRDEVLRLVEAAERSRTSGPPEAEQHAPAGTVPRSNQKMFDETALPFFRLLLVHTRQAFYSDPVYGGNREHLGWRVIGFAGPSSLAQVHEGPSAPDAYSTDSYLAVPAGEQVIP